MNRQLALITGASSGIGEALARAVAAKKFDLVLVARRLDLLELLANDLRHSHGIEVECLAMDLATDRAGLDLAQHLSARTFDLVVNNAGFGDFGPFIDSPPERVHDMVTLNVATLTDITRWALASMVARGAGRVLNVASVAGFFSGPLMAEYYATKNYVLSLGIALSEEVRGTGVTVTTLCPGPIATGFQSEAAMENSKLVKGKTQRMMSAEQCAAQALAATERGRAVIIPGTMNRVQAWATRLLPRTTVARLVKSIQAPA